MLPLLSWAGEKRGYRVVRVKNRSWSEDLHWLRLWNLPTNHSANVWYFISLVHQIIIHTINLDAKRIFGSYTLAIITCSMNEATLWHCPVDGAFSLALGTIRSCDNQPLVWGALEVQVGCIKLEYCVTWWNGHNLLVCRNECKADFAGQHGIKVVGSHRRLNPTASSNRASSRVYHHNL